MPVKKSDSLAMLVERRVSRRGLLLTSTSMATLSGLGLVARVAEARPQFERVPASSADSIDVPSGYTARVLIRWGDPLFSDVPTLDPESVREGGLLEPGAAEAQARQFGYNCDGMAVFENAQGRTVACVNHEYCSAALMFPGWNAGGADRAEYIRQNPESVSYMQAAVGLSVVELDRSSGWMPVLDSQFNRRYTANSRFDFSGPASLHSLLGSDGETPASVLGTFNNCAAGPTPWGTYITSEENVGDFFGNGEEAPFSDAAREAHTRFGYREAGSAYGWEHADPRFDMRENPDEVFKFGWMVEVDPFNPGRPPVKRTALGRFKHEGATCTLTKDGRVAAYMGDDETFEYFYKFVSRDRVQTEDLSANWGILDEGTLYVALLDDSGRGRWQPLVWNDGNALTPENGFQSQADVVLKCRAAADLVGATPLDRPEDVAVNPANARVYLSCTNNALRGSERTTFSGREIDPQADAANPRAANRFGHILEFIEDGDDAAAQTFSWGVFILAGAAKRDLVLLEAEFDENEELPIDNERSFFAGYADTNDLAGFGSPDNLAFDTRGNLWIVTDGVQPGDVNNGCFVCPTLGEHRGAVRRFMSGPVGAEICGCELSADERSLFLTIQHPGSGGTVERPISNWPDGGRAAPRPSMIVIEPDDPSYKLGD